MFRLLLASTLVLAGGGSALAQTCLHAADETPAQQARRDQAIQLALRINIEQGTTIVPNPRQHRYRRLEELRTIPPVPQGFSLQFHTDGQTYSFSLKDRTDPCGYAIFSDQDREIYEAVPRRAPVMLPLDTH